MGEITRASYASLTGWKIENTLAEEHHASVTEMSRSREGRAAGVLG